MPPSLWLLIAAAVAAVVAAPDVSEVLITYSLSNAIAVTWLSSAPANATSLRYALSTQGARKLNSSIASALSTASPSLWNGTVCLAHLLQLSRARNYTYFIADTDSGEALSSQFTLLGPPSTGDDVRFVAMGNMGVSPSASAVLEAMRTHIKGDTGMPVAALLMPGDLAFAGNDSTIWSRWAQQLSTLGLPLLTSLGHAETEADPLATLYLTRIGLAMPNVSTTSSSLWYRTDVGPVHVISVATSQDVTVGSPQCSWLAGALEEAQMRKVSGEVHFVVLIGHDSLLSTNAAANVTLANTLRASLGPLLATYRVDLALWSHVAAYERSAPIAFINEDTDVDPMTLNETAVAGQVNGTVHISLGSAGQPLDSVWLADERPLVSAYREASLGFVAITAYGHNHSLVIQFIRENGTVGDTYVMVTEGEGAQAGPVLIVASIVSIVIIAIAVLVVFLLMRRLGDVPAATYDALRQEERQESKPEEGEKI